VKVYVDEKLRQNQKIGKNKEKDEKQTENVTEKN